VVEHRLIRGVFEGVNFDGSVSSATGEDESSIRKEGEIPDFVRQNKIIGGVLEMRILGR
jgi:hypothetical protein